MNQPIRNMSSNTQSNICLRVENERKIFAHLPKACVLWGCLSKTKPAHFCRPFFCAAAEYNIMLKAVKSKFAHLSKVCVCAWIHLDLYQVPNSIGLWISGGKRRVRIATRTLCPVDRSGRWELLNRCRCQTGFDRTGLIPLYISLIETTRTLTN